MPIVAGISLRTAGKLYYFDPNGVAFERGERVLVETARGPELGTVRMPPHEVADAHVVTPLKAVLRRATSADIARDAMNREREERAIVVCKRLVEQLKLPMRLIDAQFTFDGTHVLIHFLAENRVDFRELVRELARELHARIELRQVGVRDEAKLLGGYGVCGRPLCCTTFLANFVPVAINIAKEQGLALNPQKISGMCGRLMCCLAFEYESYKSIGETLPRMNALVMTPRGEGKVTKLNVLAQQIEVTLPDVADPVWFALDELNAPGGGACCADGAPCPHTQAHPTGPSRCAPYRPAPPALPIGDSAPEDPSAGERRRPRRRRGKKPLLDGAPATPPAPDAGATDAARRRRRRPRGNPVPPAGVADTPPPPPSPDGIPPGRYSPRRRRGGPRGEGHSGTDGTAE